MIYVIDHNDSFTHNVVHQLSLFDEVECDNYNAISESKLKKASVIIFSPGPGNPKNYPSSSKIYKKFKGKKKIIGICLGFQQILFCEGAKIVEQKKIYHGFQSNIQVVNNKSLFKKGKKFKVGRYHSWVVEELNENFILTAKDIENNVMAYRHKIYKLWGVQFHPESILTEHGKKILFNWLKSK